MFSIQFTSFGYGHDGFATFTDALERVKKACFNASIYKDGEIVATWCPISGTRYYDRKAAGVQ